MGEESCDAPGLRGGGGRCGGRFGFGLFGGWLFSVGVTVKASSFHVKRVASRCVLCWAAFCIFYWPGGLKGFVALVAPRKRSPATDNPPHSPVLQFPRSAGGRALERKTKTQGRRPSIKRVCRSGGDSFFTLRFRGRRYFCFRRASKDRFQ